MTLVSIVHESAERRLTFKRVMRYDQDAKLFRVFRITYDGVWPEIPARKFSLAIRCKLTPFLLRFRWDKSWGGNFG